MDFRGDSSDTQLKSGVIFKRYMEPKSLYDYVSSSRTKLILTECSLHIRCVMSNVLIESDEQISFSFLPAPQDESSPLINCFDNDDGIGISKRNATDVPAFSKASKSA